VNTRRRPLGTVRPPARDLELSSINLRGDRGQVARLKRSIASAELAMTIDGASTLTLKVRDASRNLLRSALLRTRSVCVLDNVTYTLVKVSRDGNEVTLIFEELAINLLRRYSKPRKANRANTTRAQFIRGLVQEPHEARIPFRCPELNERQPQLEPENRPGVTPATAGIMPATAPRTVGNVPLSVLARLTVKGTRATREQLVHGQLIVVMCRRRGGDRESCAGAVATAIQESELKNKTVAQSHGTSCGLFQLINLHGTVAWRMNPVNSINWFLDGFLLYRGRGLGWLAASHKRQASAHPTAPAQWWSEGVAFTAAFIGTGGGNSSVSLGNAASFEGSRSYQVTRVEPYEFSRGSADQRETSWQCCRRLADEVQWRFFARGGAVWYVSDQWLSKQRPVAKLHEFSTGVVSLTFDYETRRDATEATLTVLTRRYGFLPGDVIQIQREGPGSGQWLVSAVRRILSTQRAEITLIRKRARLPEPAPQTRTETITVGGREQQTSGAGAFNSTPTAGPAVAASVSVAERIYAAAQEATNMRWTYSQGNRNAQRAGGQADCSSGVSWVLARAGVALPGPLRPNAPVSGAFMGWGNPGHGKVTVYSNAGHIFMHFRGFPMRRFDTGDGSGGRLWPTYRSVGGFVPRHPPGT